MPVYLIRAGDTDFVKIGWASDVARRRKHLQSGNHLPLHVIRTIEGPAATERLLQGYFRQFHHSGEWFVFQPEMLTIGVGELAAQPVKRGMRPEVRQKIKESMLASWRDGSLRRTFDQQRRRPHDP